MKIVKIRKSCIFILLLAGIMMLASQICCDLYGNHREKVHGRDKSITGILTEKKDTVDVIVLGDSESYTSISPMKMWQDTGITSFVCGQGGQRIPETYYMLKTALKTQSPKVVILETNTLFRYRGIVKGAKASLSASFKYYFPLFRYHNGWKLPFLEEKESEEEYKGFPIRSTIKSYEGGQYMNKTKDREEISTFIKIYMDKILEICDEEGIKLLLVSVPSPKNYNYKRHNAISDYAKEKGIDYLNLNLKQDELQMDWQTDSLDKGDHLNILGAHKVTEYLGTYLKEHYDLSDHRTQEDYQDWNTEAIEYNKKVKETLDGNKVSFYKIL